MKTYNKYLETLNEAWFRRKPIKEPEPVKEPEPKNYEIQSEYQSPEIETEKIQQVIDEYNGAKKLCIKYLTMRKSIVIDSHEADSYYEKSAQSFSSATILLYRIATVKDKYNVTSIDIEKEFNFLANHLIKRSMAASIKNKHIIEIFSKAVFFLNELYQYLYDDYDYEEPQFSAQIENKIVNFIWKKKSDIARIGTENIDPFQEEIW
jgi:hypothetical protein